MLEIKPIKSDQNVFQRPKNLCRQYLENQARATVVSTREQEWLSNVAQIRWQSSESL